MKFVMYRDEDSCDGDVILQHGVIGISTVEKEEGLITQMKEEQEDGNEGLFNSGSFEDLERWEFEIDEEGFIILF